MSTIIGQTKIYTLVKATNRQEQINQTLLNSNLDDKINNMLNKQKLH
jgi:hypothetical protein